ncbi:hypothetical protein H4R19_005982, partial [Coemansia spiralis]
MEVHVILVYLPPGDNSNKAANLRTQQVARDWARQARDSQAAMIVMGDLNFQIRGRTDNGRISTTTNPLLAWLAEPSRAVDVWTAAGNEDPGHTYPLRQPAKALDYIFVSPEWQEGGLACSVSRDASEIGEDHAQLWVRLPAPWQQRSPHTQQPPRGPPKIRWDALSEEERQAIVNAVESRCPALPARPAAAASANPPPTTDDDEDDTNDNPAQSPEGAAVASPGAAKLNGDNFQEEVAAIAREILPQGRGRQRGKPRTRISQTRWVRLSITTALRRIPGDWSGLTAALAAARKLTSPHVKHALVDQAREWCAAYPSTPEGARPALVERIRARCNALARKLREANGQEAGWRLLATIQAAIEARESKFRTAFGPIGRRLVKGARQSAGINRVIREDVGGTRLETDPEVVKELTSAHFDAHFAVRPNALDSIPPEWQAEYTPRTGVDYSA